MLAWLNPLLGVSEDALQTYTRAPLSWSFLMPWSHVITPISPALASQEMFLIWDASGGFAFKNCQGNVRRCENSRELNPDHTFLVSGQTSLLWWWIFVHSLTHWFPHSLIHGYIHSFISHLIHFFTQSTSWLLSLWEDLLTWLELSCRCGGGWALCIFSTTLTPDLEIP